MSSAVEKFLAQKRAEQQKSFSPQINSIAPPINERYGIKPLISGEYTGKGADGITQATMPTQGRIDSTGKPYIVDENETLVVDSKTLNDYGGPEALDKFIQSNRPGRQFACGGVPTKDRYFTGGIPSNRQTDNIQTRPRAISSDQMRLLGEIRDGARRFQDGGTPTSSGNPNLNDYFNTINGQGNPFGQINKPIDPTRPIKSDQIIQKTDPLNFSFNNSNQIIQKTDPLNLSIQTPTPIKSDQIIQKTDPLNLSIQTPTPIKSDQIIQKPIGPDNINLKVPDVGGDVSIDGTGAKSYSPKDIDEMMFQRQMARMGSQQESERAAEAQRGLQAGLSDREIQGQGAISDVGRREAQAGATADFAINQAQRLDEQEKENRATQERQKEFDEGTRRFNVQTGQWEKQFGEDKYRFNVQTGQWEKTFGLEERRFNTQTGQWEKQFNLEETKYNTGKQKDSLNTMLAAGDYKGAGKLFKDIYGSDIDFSYLEDSKKAGQWSEGFNNMIALITSGTKWEDALNIMKKDGSFAKMGMTETDLYKFYAQAQLNNDPMYKYVNTVDGWVKNKLISQDEADDMIALFKYNLTNPNGLEVLDGFAVKDKGGKEVGFFTTKEEADKYITANKDKGYVSTPVKNHVGIKGSSNNNNTNPDNNNPAINFNEFIEKLPEEGKQLKDWFSEDLWNITGKPKSYKDLRQWLLVDSNEYFVNSPKHGSLQKMTPEEKSLLFSALQEQKKLGTEKLLNSLSYGIGVGGGDFDPKLFKKKFQALQGTKTDENGDITIYTGAKDFKSCIINTERAGGMMDSPYGPVIVTSISGGKGYQLFTVLDSSGKTHSMTISNSEPSGPIIIS